MDLHPGEQILFDGHPSWRGLLSFYLSGVVGALVIGAIVALVGDVALGVAVGVVLVLLVLVVGFVRRTATDYTITTERLSIRRGILAKRVQQTRVDRVQNVNTSQSIGDRLLRVGTVDFDTAGSDDAEFRFVGIAAPSRVVEAVYTAQHDGAG